MMKKARWLASATVAIVSSSGYAQVPSAAPQPSTVSTPVTQGTAPPDSARANAASPGLEDIVVTARRVEENAQRVPLAITAIGGEGLEQKSIRNAADLSSVAPNLYIQVGARDQNSIQPSLRGQYLGDTLLSIDSPVGIYIDGVNVPRTFGLSASLVDVQRVEVLRGPQGTLYGRNTTGGALSIVTKDPSDQLGASFQGTIGNYGMLGETGLINVPLSGDLSIRLVASHNSHNGYGEDGNGRQLLNADNDFARAKFKFQSNELTIVGGVDYTNLHDNGGLSRITALTPATTTLPQGGSTTLEAAAELGLPFTAAGIGQAVSVLENLINDPNFYRTGGNGSGRKPDNRFRGANAELSANYQLSDTLALKSITGYRWFKRFTHQDLDGSPFTIVDSDQSTRDHSFSEEVQVIGGGSTFNWVAGGFYSKEVGTEFSPAGILSDLTGGLISTLDGNVGSRSLAGFAQANWHFLPHFTLTVGGRYSSDRKTLVSRNRTNFECGLPVELRDDASTCEGHFQNTFAKPTWLASLQYEFNDNSQIYLKNSRGFRSGGENYNGSGAASTFSPYRPEIVTEYEAGLKAELFDRHLRINLAAFYDNYKDVQRNVLLLATNGGIVTVYTNAASARTWGLEAESEYKVNDKLSLNASGGYLNAKYKRFVDFTGDRSAEDWPAPKFTATGGARYVQPTTAGPAALEVDYNFVSRQNFFPSAANRDAVSQKAYGLLNGRLSLQIKSADVELAVFGRNLTDAHYYVAATGLESLGIDVEFVGQPRTVGLQFTKKFGSGI